MKITEIEKVVKAFRGAIFKRSNSVSAGLFKSKIRGTGLQFKDHQIYSHGDDVRFIDWKVSARNTNIHLKTFEEERNSQIYVIFDLSPTLFYGSNEVTKLQVGLEICALLYLLTQKTNDQLLTSFLINETVVSLPPLKGKLGIISLIKNLEKLNIYTEEGRVNLLLQRKLIANQKTLISHEVKKIISKRKDVIFLSDFNYDQEFINDLMKGKFFHPIRLQSPLDQQPLRYSINSGEIKSAGLGFESNLVTKIPTLGTNEKYLELFLRRLR